MNFKIGDKVKVVRYRDNTLKPETIGLTAVITKIDEEYIYPYMLDFLGLYKGSHELFADDELELAEPEKEQINAKKIVDLLNELIELDPAIETLLSIRVNCNDKIINHSTVQHVMTGNNQYQTSFTGIINGMFSEPQIYFSIENGKMKYHLLEEYNGK
jgi:hypothetical protein